MRLHSPALLQLVPQHCLVLYAKSQKIFAPRSRNDRNYATVPERNVRLCTFQHHLLIQCQNSSIEVRIRILETDWPLTTSKPRDDIEKSLC